MALCEVRFFSSSLQKQETMNVIVPDGGGPFPTLYLLHGMSDDYSAWMRRSSIERYAEKYRLMVVMPDGHRSFYVNDPRPGGLAYEDHIIKDVIGQADRLLPTIRSRRGRAVAGLSMGGYGAMMLAMKNPSKFAAAAAHSGAMFFAHEKLAGRDDINVLASSLPRGEYDLFSLARKLAAGRTRLAIRFDCGAEDFLIQANRRFDAHLNKLGIDHQYAEHPGQHTWDYWDVHVQETLRFCRQNLARK